MRDLCERQSHDANSSVWSSGRLQVKDIFFFWIKQFIQFGYYPIFSVSITQALLRQDDTNGRVAEALTFEMRDMQSKDSTFETNPYPTGRK